MLELSNDANSHYDPVWSPDGTRIAFVSERDGNQEVYVVNADGTGLTNLTRHPARDQDPIWSPNGTHIAFVSSRYSNETTRTSGLYVMNADGSDLTNLTDGIDTPPYGAMDATWSPDGRLIAMVGTDKPAYVRDDGSIHLNIDYQIYLVNADGSGYVNLTDNNYQNLDPQWSPDGSRIAFSSSLRDSDWQLYIVNINDLSLIELTRDYDGESDFPFSPDGSHILYGYYFYFEEYGDHYAEEYGIGLVNTDGSGVVKLVRGLEEMPWGFQWSPDGSRIAFASEQDGNEEVYVINADGTGFTNLTRHPDNDWHPLWSPNGRRIVFMSVRDGNKEIYSMNADGMGLTNLTNNPANDWNPVWSPLPSK